MSEALAYPVFLVTVAVLLRARREAFAPDGVRRPARLPVAVATSVQFLAPAARVPRRGRALRSRRLSPASRCRSASRRRSFAALLVGIPGALGTVRRGDAPRPRHRPARALGPRSTRSLLPYALGLAVVPGALFGLGFMLLRPRTKFERAIAAMAIGCTVALHRPGRNGLDRGEAHRPLERYLFYCHAAVFLAFFAYVGARRTALGSYLARRASVHSRSRASRSRA